MSGAVETLAQLKIDGSPFEAGRALGQRFAGEIHRLLDNYPFFQDTLLPYHQTVEGQGRYREFLSVNRARYPQYIAELEGMAQGADRPFEELFLLNLRGEYRDYLRGGDRGCSDCTLVTESAALIGHNEDGAPAFRGNMYLVHARIAGGPPFSALTYPGFLCGNAFGMNVHGVCFSIDNVQPKAARVGVGRHLIARSLLEARSLDDAIRRVTVPGRASGFSYTVGSMVERRVIVVEVAPEAHHVREVRGAVFHTNHYLDLPSVAQTVGPSSRARLERSAAIMRQSPPRDAAGVLALLTDEAGPSYPIYRTATPPDGSATLFTALFDLDARRLRIYTAHPLRQPEAFVTCDESLWEQDRR